MPSFQLASVADADFEAGRPFTHRFTIRSPRSADDVFAEIHGLTGKRPLHWCKGIRRITWTSDAPHGTGSTREVAVSSGLLLRERYFLWDEATRVTAFLVESTNLPLFRRFGERYTVTPTSDGGSEFVWEFVAEPRAPRRLQPLLLGFAKRVDFARLERDTRAYFAS